MQQRATARLVTVWQQALVTVGRHQPLVTVSRRSAWTAAHLVTSVRIGSVVHIRCVHVPRMARAFDRALRRRGDLPLALFMEIVGLATAAAAQCDTKREPI